jgi:DNA invertase Pin-like site-specific DNA recombinase
MSLFGYASIHGDEGKAQLQARLADSARVAGIELDSVAFEETSEPIQLLKMLDKLKSGDLLLLSKVYDFTRLSSDQFDKVARVLLEKQTSIAACDVLDSVISLRSNDKARYLTSQVLIEMIAQQTQPARV